MQDLLTTLAGVAPVSEDVKLRLYNITSDKYYEKNGYFLKQGEINRHIWYIEKGLVVVFQETSKGPKVLYVLEAKDFVIATDSFNDGMPSKFNILVIEPATTWVATRSDVLETCDETDFHKHYIQIDGYYRKERDRFCSLPSKERFDELWEKRRDLFYRVPKEYLSSYVDMSEGTFDSYRRSKS